MIGNFHRFSIHRYVSLDILTYNLRFDSLNILIRYFYIYFFFSGIFLCIYQIKAYPNKYWKKKKHYFQTTLQPKILFSFSREKIDKVDKDTSWTCFYSILYT